VADPRFIRATSDAIPNQLAHSSVPNRRLRAKGGHRSIVLPGLGLWLVDLAELVCMLA
jgi:hypothetical protein